MHPLFEACSSALSYLRSAKLAACLFLLADMFQAGLGNSQGLSRCAKRFHFPPSKRLKFGRNCHYLHFPIFRKSFIWLPLPLASLLTTLSFSVRQKKVPAGTSASLIASTLAAKSNAEPWLVDRPEFLNFDFSGPLRPAKISPMRSVRISIL